MLLCPEELLRMPGFSWQLHFHRQGALSFLSQRLVDRTAGQAPTNLSLNQAHRYLARGVTSLLFPQDFSACGPSFPQLHSALGFSGASPKLCQQPQQ